MLCNACKRTQCTYYRNRRVRPGAPGCLLNVLQLYLVNPFNLPRNWVSEFISCCIQICILRALSTWVNTWAVLDFDITILFKNTLRPRPLHIITLVSIKKNVFDKYNKRVCTRVLSIWRKRTWKSIRFLTAAWFSESNCNLAQAVFTAQVKFPPRMRVVIGCYTKNRAIV